MTSKKRLQYACLASLFLLTGCGGVGETAPSSNFGSRSWSIPEGYVYEKISSEDIGDAVTTTQGFVEKDDQDGIASVLTITNIATVYLDSASLRDASTASNTRLLGYDHIDNDTVKIECGDEREVITTSRFSFLRSPLSEEKYYIAQGYFVDAKETAIISFLTQESKKAKKFLGELENITCK